MNTLKMPWCWPGPATALVVMLLSLSACSSYNYDKRISAALLFKQTGEPDEGAFSAALNARFPAGTQPAEVGAFVNAAGGNCLPTIGNKMTCSLPESGGFCIANTIGLAVQLDPGGAIQSIGVRRYRVGC